MKAKTFDRLPDSGRDVLKHVDLASARRINAPARRVNVDFPPWMVESLDKEAGRLGVTRQSLIKLWLGEKLGMVRAGARKT